MLHSYNELYLNKARTSMAHMLDFAVHDLKQDADAFFDLFVSSGLADQFGRGDAGVVLGMSGVELAYRVLDVCGINVDRISYRYTSGRSKEYWAGWALANYQWESARSFVDITAAIPIREIIAVSDELRGREIKEIMATLSWMDNLRIPDHMNEASYAEFRGRIDDALSDASITSLKRIRQLNGLSQSRLAALSGVPVRTIQQYEQRQKDINKASFESIIKLAAALSCEPGNLLEF